MEKKYFNKYHDKMEEECGIFGIYSKDVSDVASAVYYGLYALQHRGQESAGIAVSNNKKILNFKNEGLVSDVFNKENLKKLIGNSAIGHVRYATFGGGGAINAQPLDCNCTIGQMAIAHNGNLTNSKVIKELLEDVGVKFQTTIDSEVILNLIARKVNKGLEETIKSAVSAIKGAFALVILADNKLIGVRDQYGIRPLILGQNEKGDYILSSESCGIDAVGGQIIRDIKAGEMVIIDENGIKSIIYSEINKMTPCSFEYIYFARPDSIMDEKNIYKTRVEAGKNLAKQMKIEADIVIGVPDSGVPAAIGFAQESKIPYGIGLIKNKYIGRTFIVPTQELREQAVMVKLNPLKSNLKDKRVVIVDDSLIRGTTSKKIIEIVRNAGAKEVHFRSASPMVKFSCYYGIDTAKRAELLASKMSCEEIRQYINADTLDFLSIDNLLSSLGKDCEYCTGCFNGNYPVCSPNE